MYIFKNTARGNIDGVVVTCDDDDGSTQLDVLAQVDVAGDCQMIQLEDSRDIWDSLLEIGNFLVVIAQLD